MSKRYTIDEKVFTQVVEASNRFSSFGIEQTNFKTDYIHLYVMDMDDNILGQQYFSQGGMVDGKGLSGFKMKGF